MGDPPMLDEPVLISAMICFPGHSEGISLCTMGTLVVPLSA